jgi:hypothetical protein
MPATTGDGDHEILGLFYALQDQDQARRPARATQSLPVCGLPPVDAPRAIPKHVSIETYNRMEAPTLRRPDRTLSGRTSFLVVGALIAAGCFVIAIWPPEMDFTDAPEPVPSETRLSSLPQAGLAAIPLKGRTESESSEQKPESSEDKLTKSGIEETRPQALSATESTMKGDMSATSRSNSVYQAPPSSSAEAATDVRDPTPLIWRERQSFHRWTVHGNSPVRHKLRHAHRYLRALWR